MAIRRARAGSSKPRRARRSGAGQAEMRRYRRKDGSEFPFESRRQVFRSGKRWIIAAISRDITDQVRAEQALRESEARFRSLIQLSSDWYWEQDAELRFVATGGATDARGG